MPDLSCERQQFATENKFVVVHSLPINLARRARHFPATRNSGAPSAGAAHRVLPRTGPGPPRPRHPAKTSRPCPSSNSSFDLGNHGEPIIWRRTAPEPQPPAEREMEEAAQVGTRGVRVIWATASWCW